jgi:mono/diheme cytochrome c family protein
MKGVVAICGLALLAGCRQDMNDQAHHEPLEHSDFFADGAASRPLPAHTIARGQLRADTHFYTGRSKGEPVTEMPAPVSQAQLLRGRERFDIYCAPCHGRTGDGQGMIAQRGFPPPPTFHQPRLREAPVGHFYEVITNGWGLMYPYAGRVAPADRWAIIAYIRALQLSQNAALADADASQRIKLEASTP